MLFIINFLSYLQKHNSNLAMQLYYKIFSFADEKEFIKYIKEQYRKELEEYLEHKKRVEKKEKELEL